MEVSMNMIYLLDAFLGMWSRKASIATGAPCHARRREKHVRWASRWEQKCKGKIFRSSYIRTVTSWLHLPRENRGSISSIPDAFLPAHSSLEVPRRHPGNLQWVIDLEDCRCLAGFCLLLQGGRFTSHFVPGIEVPLPKIWNEAEATSMDDTSWRQR